MRQVVFIAGRAHSGSTLLDLMLSGHPRLIGVGEVYSLFDPKQKDWLNHVDEVACSCGKHMDQCAFWGPTSERLRSIVAQGKSARKSYQTFLSSFYDHFGPAYIPVDISKTDEALRVLIDLKEVEVKVVFLIRDVRSWTISMLEVNQRAGELNLADIVKKYRWKAWKPLSERIPVKYFWHWYLVNRRTKRLLQQAGLPALQVGYEELSLYPDFILKQVCEFLQIDFAANMLSLSETRGHVILGNRMRSQPNKRQRVTYDERWFYSTKWLLSSVLFPGIIRYNNREVYRNIRGHLWD
jgi:hypothetical protein